MQNVYDVMDICVGSVPGHLDPKFKLRFQVFSHTDLFAVGSFATFRWYVRYPAFFATFLPKSIHYLVVFRGRPPINR